MCGCTYGVTMLTPALNVCITCSAPGAMALAAWTSFHISIAGWTCSECKVIDAHDMKGVQADLDASPSSEDILQLARREFGTRCDHELQKHNHM